MGQWILWDSLEIPSDMQKNESVTHSVVALWDPWTATCQASLSFISWSLHNSCPLSQWHHPTISSSVVSFSFCLQSFPALGSFPVSQLFPLGGQSTGASASASASVLPIPLGWTGWISLLSKGLSRVFSNTTVQKHQFFSSQFNSLVLSFLHSPTLTSIHDHRKNHTLD